jgi:hypothetical protein
LILHVIDCDVAAIVEQESNLASGSGCSHVVLFEVLATDISFHADIDMRIIKALFRDRPWLRRLFRPPPKYNATIEYELVSNACEAKVDDVAFATVRPLNTNPSQISASLESR